MRRTSPAPKGWHSITPRLVADDPPSLIRFLRKAFRATGTSRRDLPTVMKIGDSLVMVSGAGPRPATAAFLYLYVVDADAIYERAVKAGARPVEAPADMPYGDRRAMVEDPSGNVWQIATRVRGSR
jgi:PhnB protein